MWKVRMGTTSQQSLRSCPPTYLWCRTIQYPHCGVTPPSQCNLLLEELGFQPRSLVFNLALSMWHQNSLWHPSQDAARERELVGAAAHTIFIQLGMTVLFSYPLCWIKRFACGFSLLHIVQPFGMIRDNLAYFWIWKGFGNSRCICLDYIPFLTVGSPIYFTTVPSSQAQTSIDYFPPLPEGSF